MTDHATLTRRRLLKSLGLISVAASSPSARSAHWSNWSQGQQADAADIVYARDEDDVVATVKRATTIRAFGGSHSFSPIVPTPGTLISLDQMNGIVEHDAAAHTATLWAGTRLGQAGYQLSALGQALMNEPDINLQSVGGSVSTAVHGTGRQLRCMSAYVQALRLVLASGETVHCSAAENPELFQAARVAIGSLGIITQVTLQNAPLYRLQETLQLMDIEAAMEKLQREKDKHRHIEFLGFIDGNEALVKYHDIVTALPDTPPAQAMVDENHALELAAKTAQHVPWLNRALHELVSLFISEHIRVGPSWRIFPSPRAVPFNEMEYQVPADTGMACFEEIRHAMRKSGIQVFFPLEFRYVKADDVWLSPFHARDSISISVHQYYRQDYRPLFALVEPIFRKYQGRPHWGKLHTCKAQDFQMMYPRWNDFLKVREHYDPAGKFLNDHLREAFGVRA